MKFPFISRERHEEMVNRLEKELSEAKADRQKLVDALSVYGLGQAVYAQNPVMPASEPEPETPILPSMDMTKHPRQLQREIEAKMQEAFKHGKPNPLLDEIDAVILAARHKNESLPGPIARVDS